jgi:hypothetical protein
MKLDTSRARDMANGLPSGYRDWQYLPRPRIWVRRLAALALSGLGVTAPAWGASAENPSPAVKMSQAPPDTSASGEGTGPPTLPDAQPIPQPPDWEPDFWGHQYHEAIVEPLSHAFDIPDKMLFAVRLFGVHTRREAVDVNAFDEVPNSTWFTNRNAIRYVPDADLARGPYPPSTPTKPWIIKHVKHGGVSEGFQIKDADGKKWFVKLDPRNYPQMSTGADMIGRTLVYAAGYNVPDNQPVRFRRGDLTIDEDLARGAKGERLTASQLDTLLSYGAIFPDSAYSGIASLFLPGHVLGAPSMRRARPGDSNDWYQHKNRRELRGLYVICSWIGDWDMKDQQFLDTFVARSDSLGHVDHYLLDVGSSFGAQADSPKALWEGYENTVDFGWISRRIITLGFTVEPWRRAHQYTGIPSVGNFESEVFHPAHFATEQPQAAFREMTDADAYWGAKIVASFSNEQIVAAVSSAHYEDPRATEFLVKSLIERRDKIARYWFSRVAPLDFFCVRDGILRFHDLAADIGLAGPREYEVTIEAEREPHHRSRLASPAMDLRSLGGSSRRASLSFAISGSGAKPARVDLTRSGNDWIVTRVRHGW